jgi:hypothetical protein
VDDETAVARFEAGQERMDELTDQLPIPSRSFIDIVLRAQVAFCHADKDEHYRLVGLSPDDEAGDDRATAVKLTVAVLQFAGIDFH